MKLIAALTVFLIAPALATPRCIVVHDGICFETQSEYDEYMGWDSKQQQLETEANN
jgi:hypothetical protein